MKVIKPNFVFFSSHTHVLPFTIIECMLGDVVEKMGSIPTFLKPAACTCQLIAQINGEVKHCEQCSINDHVLHNATPKWIHASLDACRDMKDDQIADQHLLVLTPDTIQSFSVAGVPIGKISLHDTLLHHKHDNLLFQVDTMLWHDIIKTARACILLTLRLRRYFTKNAFYGLVVYNSHYSVNRSAVAVAEQMGIKVFSMHGGASLKYLWDTLMFTRGDIDQHKPACVKNWEMSYSSKPISRRKLDLLEGHFKALFDGSMAHAYSAPIGMSSCAELLAKVNPEGKRKVLLAATSSADERFALEQSGIRNIYEKTEYLFPTQIDWLEFIISQMRQHPELGLIIRIHPRELPNKREGITSTNARRLQALLVNLPDNVVINWPTDNISFYDLMLRVDLILTCWSSVALESSIFGAPIVLPYNPVRYYDVIADRVSRDKAGYWETVCKFSSGNWTLDRAIITMRWLWMVQFESNVSLFSKQSRNPGLYEKLIEFSTKIRNFLLSKGVHIKNPFSNYTRAFATDYKKLTHRRINFEGEGVIRETFWGHLNPLHDFEKMQAMQPEAYGVGDNSTTAHERREALAMIERLLQILRPDETVGQKVNAMITAAKADLKY